MRQHSTGARHDGLYLLTNMKRTVRIGVKSIWLHRLRSLLTVLGIVFGVCSVIAMLAVSEGASKSVQEQIRKLGSNNIIIQSKKPPSEEQRQMGGAPTSVEYGITYDDVKTIRAILPAVRIVLPGRIIRDYVRNLSRNIDAEIVGTVPWYPEMRNHRVDVGRFFTDAETDDRLNVCVLGADAAQTLFPIDDPIGKNVRVRSSYYRVVGVMDPLTEPGAEDSTAAKTQGPIPRIYIPLTAARYRFGETLMKRSSGSFESETVELHEVIVQVKRQSDVVETARVIDEILDRNHKKDDYTLTVPLELLRNAEETKRIFNTVLGAIAGISLVVGGIGIMNIMLASVTERTSEIGVRRALGAKKRDIVEQFLVETVILSGSGGVMGVALGIMIPFFITYFSKMPTVITFWSPPLAFSISALVGVIFGIYPAMRAANMDPVEALRHE